MALAGDVIIVTGNKVGFTTNFKVYTTVDGTEQLVEVAVTNGTFTMPDSNVIIVVTGYTPNDVAYTDKDGNDKTAPYGTVNQIVITACTFCRNVLTENVRFASLDFSFDFFFRKA